MARGSGHGWRKAQQGYGPDYWVKGSYTIYAEPDGYRAYWRSDVGVERPIGKAVSSLGRAMSQAARHVPQAKGWGSVLRERGGKDPRLTFKKNPAGLVHVTSYWRRKPNASLRNNPSVAELVGTYRAAHPRSRAMGLFRFCKNSSATKQKECILCGARGPSWNAAYPQTKRAGVWEREHALGHTG